MARPTVVSKGLEDRCLVLCLTDCFGDQIEVKDRLSRWKHWFQEDDLSIVEEDSAVVVSMFRDPMVR